MSNLTLALDVMGGDYGPQVTVPAALQALAIHPQLKIILVGDQTEISSRLKNLPSSIESRLDILHASEVVQMCDRPVFALRHRKQSSMRLALDLVRLGKADACVSAGNTGALMAIAKVLLKTLPGVDRPALVSRLPTSKNRPVYLLDLGANVSCDAEALFQFAIMGSVLCEAVEKLPHPRLGLLNVGIEEIKGNNQVQQAAQYLQDTPQVNYVGYVEGDEIYTGNLDVIVCDGFVGNITLKTSEGIARHLMKHLKKGLSTGFFERLLAKLLAAKIQKLFVQMNPDHYNGASLIGLRGVVVKSHGNADEQAFLRAINLATMEAQRRLPEMIKERLESIFLDINN